MFSQLAALWSRIKEGPKSQASQLMMYVTQEFGNQVCRFIVQKIVPAPKKGKY
jgi:uncharacterized membrane protein YwzB